MSGQIRIFKNWQDKFKGRISGDDSTRTPNRFECNKIIISKLSEFLKDNPDIRYGQALWILDILDDNIDSFNEEPLDMLNRLSH